MEVTINGQKHQLQYDTDKNLLEVLRDDLHLTGPKYGCGEGQCGACTILLDGRPIRACTTSVASVAGQQILTIEGLEKDGELHPLQKAFMETDAFQCGYCTPGMILAGVALLNKNADPSYREIVNTMQGHICRCGAQPRIISAIGKVARATKEQGE